MSALLNYKLEGTGDTVVLIHGLFGNLDNLGLIARDLKVDHQVLSIDLRNHGTSFHHPEHNYSLMAEDVLVVINELNIELFSVIGHSMGGKVAMKLADLARERVAKLIVLDMAPVKYTERRHDNVIDGLKAVTNQQPTSRNQALEVLAQHIKIDGVRQFLSKSLYKKGDIFTWRFNVDSIVENYWDILDWSLIEPLSVPTLFLKGAESDYILAEHQPQIKSQFSNAKAHIIAKTGHWLHAEKPAEVIRAIRKFI